MKRRDFLKRVGVLATGVALTDSVSVASTLTGPAASCNIDADEQIRVNIRGLKADVGRQLTAVIIGAGNRGRCYSGYARRYPDVLKIVGVSDILDDRKNAMGDLHDIPVDYRFGHYDEFLARPKIADIAIISTPDDRHYELCMKALELGYDVLLEKPVAQTEKECRDILKQARKYNRIVGVCHVLRYAPYFIAVREMVQSGKIGDLVSIQHQEPIEFAHMAHSYVRGNWRSSKETTPIILAKSCHDLDILRWIVGKPCKSISADGSLHLFKKENTPEGAPYRCTDGCPHESSCPFYAPQVYVKRKRHLGVFDLKNKKDEEEIMAKLIDSPYNRCVYQCDNDQPDHYVVTMTFEGKETASFSMDAFTPWGGRRTRIMGTKGYIEGDGVTFSMYDFKTLKKSVWAMEVEEVEEYKGSGHGGGDYGVVRDFLEAVDMHDDKKLSSTLEASIESHVMGFAAEKSRKSMKKVKIKM